MLDRPSDRAKVSERAVAAFGGKKIATYGTLGEYDMLFIYEMPDTFNAVANLHLMDGFGVAKYSKVIPLIGEADFLRTQIVAGEARDVFQALQSAPKPS